MEKKETLASIKEEILKKVGAEKKNKKGLRLSSIVVTSILVLLAIFSIIQTAQSAAILNEINSGAVKASGTATGSSVAPLPSNLQNLPSMVGGC
jgi:hypothetical protein